MNSPSTTSFFNSSLSGHREKKKWAIDGRRLHNDAKAERAGSQRQHIRYCLHVIYKSNNIPITKSCHLKLEILLLLVPLEQKKLIGEARAKG